MRRLRFLTLAALVAAVACSDEGPVSGPGQMTVTLRSPNGDEGAAVVVLLGDDVGTVTPAGDTDAYPHSGDGSTRIVLVNPFGGTLGFRVMVADTTQPPAFEVREVAGPDDALRPSLSGYALEFAR